MASAPLVFRLLVLRPPRVRRPPQLSRPSPGLVFAAVLLGYFLVLSGVIHDVITETPSMGRTRNPKTGAVRPQAFMPYRINGQYIIEGLAAGLMFCVGAAGFIMLDTAIAKSTRLPRVRYLLLAAGAICVGVAYNLCLVFVRMKVPGYLA